MTDMEERAQRLRGWLLVIFVVNMLLMGWFTCHSWNAANGLAGSFLGISTVGYAFLFSIPELLLLWIAGTRSSGQSCRTWLRVAGICSTVTTVYLLSDAFLLAHYKDHFGPMAINLIGTRGGLESMGLDKMTVIPVIVMVILLFCLYIGLGSLFFKEEHSCGWRYHCGSRWIAYPVFVLGLLCLTSSIVMTGLADFYLQREVLARQKAFPMMISIRMRHALRGLGCQEPDRSKWQMVSVEEDGIVNYPINPIRRDSARKKPNIIWLVAESMRADLLTEEIMPSVMALSKEGARCALHYSGGNGTRPAMFSMFYGLYGTNWKPFLKALRGALFFDWLQEDQYQILCQTSAMFTYPEFDKTIFAALPAECLKEYHDGEVVERDRTITKNLLDFVANRDKSRPFFAFCFYEATHAPYSFPEENPLRKEYMDSINYLTVSKEDAPMLRNREINAAHFLDGLMGQIINMVGQDPALKENTIIIVVGDHGEEFYEKGELGHNSTFSEEQIRPPLVFRIPGQGPRVFTGMTHHTDIIPTLAPFLGVTNAPADFCVGRNLLSPNWKPRPFVVSDWDDSLLVTERYKYFMPLSVKNMFAPNKLTHRDDTPVTEEENDSFRKENISQIQACQEEMTRFVKHR